MRLTWPVIADLVTGSCVPPDLYICPVCETVLTVEWCAACDKKSGRRAEELGAADAQTYVSEL